MFNNFYNIIYKFLDMENKGKEFLELDDRYNDHGQNYYTDIKTINEVMEILKVGKEIIESDTMRTFKNLLSQ
jgi:hypothetical protein